MKTFTTSLIAFFLCIGMASAQVVFVNSPMELEGAYLFDAAGFGADLLSDTWTGDAEFVDDGSGADASQGCGDLVNDLTDKIALIDRGSCEFGIKVLNAENAGAIAAIVFNNAPGAGTIVMGAGANGGMVTIPSVMLSYEDGQLIRAALENGTVNITIGNILFENNISFADSNISLPPYGIYPASQIGDGGLILYPGASYNNDGTAGATDANLTATIEYTPFGGSTTEVYNETGTLAGVVMPDSISDIQVLPTFELTEGPGQYTITYGITTAEEDAIPADNTISRTITITDGMEGMVSKARWDMADNAPASTSTFYTIGGGGDVQFSVPMHLPNGEGGSIDTLLWRVLKNDPNLADVSFEGYVYQWDDLNGDTLFTNDELTAVGIAPFTFDSDETATSAVIRAEVLSIGDFEPGVTIPDNNTYYIIGARYTGPDQVFFGFDEMYDHATNQQIKLSIGNYTDLDLNYLVSNEFGAETIPDYETDGGRFTGIPGAAVSIGMIVSNLVSSTEEVLPADKLTINMFPNPTTELLNIELDLNVDTKYVEYSIRDASGKQVFLGRDNSVFSQERETLNVKQLPAGQYYLTIRTEQGIQTAPFVVSH